MFREDLGEYQVDLEKLPPSLRDVVEVEEFHKVLCRKS